MTASYPKGKSAIKIYRGFMGYKSQFAGMHFFTPGNCVITIGLKENQILEYVKNQEKFEKQKLGQLDLSDFN